MKICYQNYKINILFLIKIEKKSIHFFDFFALLLDFLSSLCSLFTGFSATFSSTKLDFLEVFGLSTFTFLLDFVPDGLASSIIPQNPVKSYSMLSSLNLILRSFSFYKSPSTLAALQASVFSSLLYFFLKITLVGTYFHSLLPFLKVSLCGVSTI